MIYYLSCLVSRISRLLGAPGRVSKTSAER